MTKLSPYREMLTPMRRSGKTCEEGRRFDVLTVLIAKLPSLVVDFCHSKALPVPMVKPNGHLSAVVGG